MLYFPTLHSQRWIKCKEWDKQNWLLITCRLKCFGQFLSYFNKHETFDWRCFQGQHLLPHSRLLLFSLTVLVPWENSSWQLVPLEGMPLHNKMAQKPFSFVCLLLWLNNCCGLTQLTSWEHAGFVPHGCQFEAADNVLADPKQQT